MIWSVERTFEKKAEVYGTGDVGVRYGDMEVEEGMGIAPVSLVLHFHLTSLISTWTYTCSIKYLCNQECYRLLLH